MICRRRQLSGLRLRQKISFFRCLRFFCSCRTKKSQTPEERDFLVHWVRKQEKNRTCAQTTCIVFDIRYSLPLDKNIPFYRCLRFFYPGLLSQPRLYKEISGLFSDYLSLMRGLPSIRLNNLKTGLRFPCLGLNSIIDSISHCIR